MVSVHLGDRKYQEEVHGLGRTASYEVAACPECSEAVALASYTAEDQAAREIRVRDLGGLLP